MSLGEKLQSVHSKVNTKLGTQDGPVIFRKQTTTAASEIGKPYESVTNTDVTIESGIKIGRLKAYETDAAGTFMVDDLKLTVPANKITEEQLTGAVVIYGDKEHAIISCKPTEIFGGDTVQWVVIARQQGEGDD